MRFIVLNKISFPEVNSFGEKLPLNWCFLPKTKKNGVPIKNNHKKIPVYHPCFQEVSIIYFLRQSWTKINETLSQYCAKP